MRYSKQREALLQLLRSTTSHPDAEWLYTSLRKEHPNISLGTVYRNLRQLAEIGDILELNDGMISHFDGDISPHYHMKCNSCGGIYDVHKDNVSITVKTMDSFRIDGFSLMLNGICKSCQKEI